VYGTKLPNISSHRDFYGFINENQVRLSAGLTLALAIYSFISILFFASYSIPLVFMFFIWLDFVLKVFIGPKASIFLFLVKPFVKKVYWVGTFQKRFA
jgi:hypothetical protein